MKRSIGIITILLFSILLSSCSTKNETITREMDTFKPSPKQEIKLVPKSNKIKYLQSNGIAINSIEKFIDTPKGEAKITLTQIDGLKNKDIENKINKDIEENMISCVKNPIETSTEKPFASSYVELNANNLISITIHTYFSGFREGLLYRLSDGKRLYLKDIFTEGTDYVSLLNRIIIEKILGGYDEESDILRVPFSTIAPNQAFTINETSIGILFREGEAGFALDYEIRILLSEIDDYVDLIDKQKDLDKSIYEKPYNTLKYNNIFFNESNERIQTKDGNVSLTYPIISGMENPDIENNINKTIGAKADEILDSYYLKDLKTLSMYVEGDVTLNMHVSFNYYDYLCITWSRYLYPSESGLPDISLEAYTFDLKTGKLVDEKKLFNSYANNNEAFKAAFTEKILEDFKYFTGDKNIARKMIHGTDTAYDYLLKNSKIYFICYSLSDEPRIRVYLEENLISPNAFEAEAGLNTVLHTAPNLFFK